MNTPRDTSHTLTALATVRLVAGREIAERLHSRLIWIMTALTTLLVVALIVIPPLVQQPATPTMVGLVGPSAQALGPSLRAIAGTAQIAITVVDVPNGMTARADLQQGSIDVSLSVGAQTARAEVLQMQTLSPTMQAVLQAVLDDAHQRQVLAGAGVPLATVRDALAPVPFSTTSLQPAPMDHAASDVAAWATGVLLMISLGLYGTAVATGVAQEKTSRMAEVLLAAVRPSQLLAGKVLGIGVCGVGQLAIVVVAGLIANAAVQSAEIPATVWVLLPTVLLWFVLGYALYSFAYAAAGALVGRQEDVQFVSLPFGLPIFGGYLLPPPHGAHDEVGRWLNELGLGGRRASSSRPSRIPST